MNLILFRYILKQFFLIFFATLFVLAAVVLMFDIIELLRNASKRENVAFLDVAVLGLLKSPQMIHIILPFVILLSGIIFLFRMNRTSELIVMRAVGLSVWNFTLPLILATFIIGVFDTTVFNPFSALTAKKYERLEEKVGMKSRNPFSFTEKGLWLREQKNENPIVIRAGRLRQENKNVMLDNITVFELNPNDTLIRQIDAPSGILKDGELVLDNAFSFNPNEEKSEKISEISFQTDFNLERILERFDEPNTMSFWKFPQFIQFLKESGFFPLTHQMYWHELIAFPVFLVAMVLIGIVFTLPPTNRQGRVLLRLILALSCGFLLFFLGRVTSVLGLSQNLPLILAAWGPALIVIPLCVSALLHLEDG